jgi:inorganic pyrophosphatase
MPAVDVSKVSAFYEDSDFVNIVIDTPKSSPYKLKYEEEAGLFRAHKALPLGLAFPFNFGFLPGTEGGDGDPLDVLVLTEFIMPLGAVVLGQLISVLEAEQTEKKKKYRNDRLIAIPIELISRKPMQPQTEFNDVLKKAIVDFFIKYNELQNKTFRPLRFSPAKHAIQAVRNGLRNSKPSASSLTAF